MFGIKRLINKAIFFIRVVFKREFRISGYKVDFDLTENIQQTIFMGNFENEETQWVKDILKPGDIFIDVGANVGYYSLVASRLVGVGGRVYAFEPEPTALNNLKKTIRINNITNIFPFSYGLGECFTTDNLVTPDPAIFGNVNSPTCVPGIHPTAKITLKIHIIPLDSFCQNHFIKNIDLVKMDVEGYEPKVIKGMDRLLREKRVKWMFIELLDTALVPAGSSAKELDTIIKSYGFVQEKERYYDNTLRNVLYKLEQK